MADKNTSTPRKGSKPIGANSKSSGSNRRVLWIVVGAAVALLALLAIVAIFSNRSPQSTAQPGTTVADQIGQPIDRRLMGSPDAPVLIEAWEDFQCPHCQDFAAALDETIRTDLVAPGTAQFQFNYRFVIGPDSITAGMAAECAADQGRFYDYHDLLFAELRSNPRAAAQVTPLKDLASQLGLNTDEFNRCLDSREHYADLLKADNDAANQGINSTPTVRINGEQYSGPFTPEVFVAAVEAAAAQAGAAQ
ncbi:MAG: thioredoxin domain-containing protein [Caldilineales bacterium]|nr:thioredoxin domain-containing protein [Caldilineales bacterium]